jgi:hypothetical protein
VKRSQRIAAVTFAVGLLVAPSPRAYADGKGQGSGDSGAIGSSVDGPGTSTGGSGASGQRSGGGSPGRGGSSAGAKMCTAADGTFGPITAKSADAGDYEPVPPPPGVSPDGDWYVVLCGGEYKDLEWVPTGTVPPGSAAPAPPAVTGAEMAQRAKKITPLNPPLIQLNPPADQDQLVQLATWLWTEPAAWHPEHASATIPGISATTTAIPVGLAFDMGDSQPASRFTCAGPGTPYDSAHPEAPSRCTYSYPRSSAGHSPNNSYRITAWIDWHVTWVASDGTSGDFGIIRGLPSTQLVRVAEVQAINTSN